MTHGSDRIDYHETPDVTEVHAAIQREHKDPVTNVTPVPLWVTLLCGVAVCWAGAYVGMFHGGFSSNVYNEYESSPVALFSLPQKEKSKAGPAAAEDPIAVGKGVYSSVCQACHQPNGMGVPGAFPPLAGSEFANGSEKRMAAIVLKGLLGPVKVNGVAFNNSMPAQEAQLTDKKIAAVLTYVRQEWGNKAGPVQPAQIAAARKEFKDRTTQWSEAELLQIPAEAVLEGGAPAGSAPTTSAPPGAPPTAAAATAPAPAKPATPTAPAQPVATAQPTAPAPAAPTAAAAPAPGGGDLAASIERGKAVYMQTCFTCHQATGQGVPGAFPPLAGTDYTTGDARRMVAIVIKGINPPFKVNNVPYVVPMPPPDLAFPILKEDAKVADVVNYVRNSFGNKDAKGVTAEFVAGVRKEFASRTAPWTEAELQNFPPAK